MSPPEVVLIKRRSGVKLERKMHRNFLHLKEHSNHLFISPSAIKVLSIYLGVVSPVLHELS